jgi:hypothetical protein
LAEGFYSLKGNIDIKYFSRVFIFSLIWTKNISPSEVIPVKRCNMIFFWLGSSFEVGLKRVFSMSSKAHGKYLRRRVLSLWLNLSWRWCQKRPKKILPFLKYIDLMYGLLFISLLFLNISFSHPLILPNNLYLTILQHSLDKL